VRTDFDQVGRALGAIGVHFTIRVYDVMAECDPPSSSAVSPLMAARIEATSISTSVQPISASSARSTASTAL